MFYVGGWRQARSFGFCKMVVAACDVVGLAIAEYMPWEAITTRNMLRKLPLLDD